MVKNIKGGSMRSCSIMLISILVFFLMDCSEPPEPVNYSRNNGSQDTEVIKSGETGSEVTARVDTRGSNGEFRNLEAVAMVLDSCDGCVVVDVEVDHPHAQGKIHTLTPGRATNLPGFTGTFNTISVSVTLDGRLSRDVEEYIDNNTGENVAIQVKEREGNPVSVKVIPRSGNPVADHTNHEQDGGNTQVNYEEVIPTRYVNISIPDEQAGVIIKIPARKVAKFKAGKDLSEAVRGIVTIDPNENDVLVQFIGESTGFSDELLSGSTVQKLSQDETAGDVVYNLPVINLRQLDAALGKEIAIVKEKR